MVLLAAPGQPLGAQSRTEDAKDRLDGKDDPAIVQAARIAWHIGIDVMPAFFYFQPIEEDEPKLRYNRHPYQDPQFSGIRNFDDGYSGLWDIQGTFSLPQTSRAMQQVSATVKRNIGYWSLSAGYEYLKEDAAPYPIHQGQFLIGRKFRFHPKGDGGLQFGMRTLQLDGDYYPGPDIGVNLEMFPLRPFSIGYQGNWTYTRFADVINHQLDLGIHLSSSRVFFRYRWLDIGGIKFDTLTAGYGIYF
ncbi:hypothetical protein [Natronogracilivirga saccharolytica]|uniref:Uncharacterized protein n=1 Tax=Natronogracilivirga saccharolytica TaxID=2812953 RepID=A0A8J7UU75_9BACT|nr:hypothetical protein [Natronogracilivirga saccharolytica]MBP3193326.1 hypothetical protein [Natronogracilivirga saccharolytica]